LGEVVLK